MQKSLLAFFVLALSLAFGSSVPNGAKIFITPMDGQLDTYIAPEILKQKLPVIVVLDEADADYVLVGASSKADDKWYRTIGGGKEKNEGMVRLLNVKAKTLVWIGEAGDRSLLGNTPKGAERKIAERIVKKMKKDCF